jgi:hypothetical protein
MMMSGSVTRCVEAIVNEKILPHPLAAARRHNRLSLNIAVRVFLENGQFANGRGHDVGAGGMAVYVPLEFAVRTSLNISFQLPYSRLVLGVRAIARNSNGFRYGVEFLNLTPYEATEIERVTSILELTA